MTQPTESPYSYGSTVKSYILETSGGLLRIEGQRSQFQVEEFSLDGKRKSVKTIPTALPFFGAFYESGDSWYVVSGQENPNDSDDVPVLAIQRFSKSGQELASNILRGQNTSMPFDFGSCSIAAKGSSIVVHTCHVMYRSSDNLKHQANMTFVFDNTALHLTDSWTDVMNIAQAGYVSHSFNQFVRSDGSSIYRVDHGDAYPRAVTLSRVKDGNPITRVDYTLPFDIKGFPGNNFTGLSLGGFELSSSNCLIAGRSFDQNKYWDGQPSAQNIFLTVTDKDLMESKTVWLTDYSVNDKIKIGTPKLVRISDTLFLVMWNQEQNGVRSSRIVAVTDQGVLASDVAQDVFEVSECQPVLFSDGTVRWYTGNGNKAVLNSIRLYSTPKASGIIQDDDGPNTGGDTGDTAVRVPMNRLYNPNSGEHFYTASTKEKDYLVSIGWKDESIGWIAPKQSSTPVYRLYNRNAGDHHYTTNTNERSYLISVGWTDEGIGWYSDDAKGIPLYRQYNPNAKAGSHNYTTNKNENDYLAKIGWHAEGISWYGLK